jgi:hypothetical protein
LIIEWITSRLTPASSLARLIGYVDSSIALAHRYKRCKKAWAPHVSACHDVILSERPSNAKNILIVGSGLLLEIPFEELLQDPACRITLVDVVHPISVRKRVRDSGDRVQLIEMDVTGSAKLLAKKINVTQFTQLKFSPPLKGLNNTYDYVVSANIISQLSLDPFERLRRCNSRLATDEFFAVLSQHMGRQHVEWVKNLGQKVLLISDVNRTYYDRTGQEIDQTPSAYVTRDGKLIKSWNWLISPMGETSKDFSYSMLVEARVL